MKLNQKHRKGFSREWALRGNYFDGIPLDEIFAVLEETTRCYPVQEDGARWSGLLCGAEGMCDFPLKANLPEGCKIYMRSDPDIKNSVLRLSWYEMRPGRYEIVAYLS